MSQISTVEDAMITVLKDVFGNRLKLVDTGPADVDEQVIEQMRVFAPAAYVVFGGGDRVESNVATVKAQMSVVAVTANAGGNKPRRRGDKQQIGAYDIVEIASARLHNMCVSDIGSLSFSRIENLYSDKKDKKGIAVYAAVFDIEVGFKFDNSWSVLDAFEVFGSDINGVITNEDAPGHNHDKTILEQ